MPTGLTQRVIDGEVNDLNGFAWVCARQFGALVTMRDEPQNAPIVIPEKYEPDPDGYYLTKLPEDEAALKAIEEMSTAAAQEAADERRREIEERQAKYDAEAAQNKARCEAILKEVTDWAAPKELVQLKEYMVEQLVGTIDHDGSPLKAYDDAPKTAVEFRERETQRLKDEIARFRKSLAEQVERGEERLKWLHELQGEVGSPPVAP